MTRHIEAARARKVAAVCAVIDAAAPTRAPADVVRWLRRLPQAGPSGAPSWASLALCAGKRPLSAASQADVIAEYGVRHAMVRNAAAMGVAS